MPVYMNIACDGRDCKACVRVPEEHYAHPRRYAEKNHGWYWNRKLKIVLCKSCVTQNESKEKNQ